MHTDSHNYLCESMCECACPHVCACECVSVGPYIYTFHPGFSDNSRKKSLASGVTTRYQLQTYIFANRTIHLSAIWDRILFLFCSSFSCYTLIVLWEPVFHLFQTQIHSCYSYFFPLESKTISTIVKENCLLSKLIPKCTKNIVAFGCFH